MTFKELIVLKARENLPEPSSYPEKFYNSCLMTSSLGLIPTVEVIATTSPRNEIDIIEVVFRKKKVALKGLYGVIIDYWSFDHICANYISRGIFEMEVPE